MRKLALAAAAIVLAAAGLGASLILASLGTAASQTLVFPVTICHPTGSASMPYTTLVFQNQNALNGHTGAAHPNGPDIIPAPAGGCPTGSTTSSTVSSTTTTIESVPSTTTTVESVPSTTTTVESVPSTTTTVESVPSTSTVTLSTTTTKSTTTVTVPSTTTRPPPIITLGPPALVCRLADHTQPYLRLNVVEASDTSTTIGMEKDILECAGAATQTRDLETFIEVVQQATPTGLTDVAVRINTALCIKDFSVGRVQCSRKNVPLGGELANPLGGCKNASVQPAEPVQMVGKGVGDWFKTTKLEKQVVECPNGVLGDLYVFTDVLSANPPTAGPSTTTFRAIFCSWTPSAGVPPSRCNVVKTT